MIFNFLRKPKPQFFPLKMLNNKLLLNVFGPFISILASPAKVCGTKMRGTNIFVVKPCGLGERYERRCLLRLRFFQVFYSVN
jgi:hypothetical protein